MKYLHKNPHVYPEISFLSFDVLALLAKIQNEMELDSVGPISFTLQSMQTLAYIHREQEHEGNAIYMHSLFNRPDVPKQVIEHVLSHELLHLKIPAREINGELVQHPPEFWEAEQVLVPWKEASWMWMFLAFWEFLKPDPDNECVWVKKSWRKLQKQSYPQWQMVLEGDNKISSNHDGINRLIECL